jgi:hypothetical protein
MVPYQVFFWGWDGFGGGGDSVEYNLGSIVPYSSFLLKYIHRNILYLYILEGGGGGGFYSNGCSSTEFGEAYGVGGKGGSGFVQGGAGGRAKRNNVVGGFGGGGGAYGFGGGAGGGGGYSGGASGENVYNSCGGGGGSFNSGKNQVNTEGYQANGHGYVIIKHLIWRARLVFANNVNAGSVEIKASTIFV